MFHVAALNYSANGPPVNQFLPYVLERVRPYPTSVLTEKALVCFFRLRNLFMTSNHAISGTEIPWSDVMNSAPSYRSNKQDRPWTVLKTELVHLDQNKCSADSWFQFNYGFRKRQTVNINSMVNLIFNETLFLLGVSIP